MKKKRKRKKSSARRGADTSEEDSDSETKVHFLCKKQNIIVNVPIVIF